MRSILLSYQACMNYHPKNRRHKFRPRSGFILQHSFSLSPTSLTPLFFSFFFPQEGERLMAEKPELSSMVQEKLNEIWECWLELENLTQVKALQLFENDRAQQISQNYARLNERVQQLEVQLNHCDYGHDLTSVNKQLKKLQVLFQP